MKLFAAVLMTAALFTSLSAPCLAAFDGPGAASSTSRTSSETELTRQMEALGFTQDEIDTILQLERERIQRGDPVIGYGRSSRMKRAAFPSKPKEGDWHYETFDAELSDINWTAAGIAKILVGGGVKATVAIGMARIIASKLIKNSGYTTLRVNMSYRYGITNDGYMGWSYGPVTWELL